MSVCAVFESLLYLPGGLPRPIAETEVASETIEDAPQSSREPRPTLDKGAVAKWEFVEGKVATTSDAGEPEESMDAVPFTIKNKNKFSVKVIVKRR